MNMMEDEYFLAKWLNNEMTGQELAQFESSPEFEKYQRIKIYTSQLDVSNFDENLVLSNILSAKKKESKVISLKNKNWFLKIAAILVLGLGIVFLSRNFSEQTQYAANGTKSSFSLPDHSEVVLNSGSEISYKKWNWDNNRNIKLIGEAYFHVAKGKKFEVVTSLGKVAVLGTQFNVKTRKNRFDVTCYEGRVKVNYNKIEIILTHGQTVMFENGIQTKAIIDNLKPEWLENKIAFNNENLRNILDEIERQYNVSIKMNGKMPDDLFTGKIPIDNLNIALQIISTTYNLNHSDYNKKNIIFERK
jgi:transmembrane sensor